MLQASARGSKLEKQLRFYQQQASEAMCARDSATLDCERARADCRHLEGRATKLERQVAAERAESGRLARELQVAQDRVAAVSDSERELERRRAWSEQLRAERDSLQVRPLV